jgi:hypothetical protein
MANTTQKARAKRLAEAARAARQKRQLRLKRLMLGGTAGSAALFLGIIIAQAPPNSAVEESATTSQIQQLAPANQTLPTLGGSTIQIPQQSLVPRTPVRKPRVRTRSS